jgi:hypothetical protein
MFLKEFYFCCLTLVRVPCIVKQLDSLGGVTDFKFVSQMNTSMVGIHVYT